MRFFHGLFLLLLAASACGGKVAVDPPETSSCAEACAKVVAACPSKGSDCSACVTIDSIRSAGTCVSEIDAYIACLDQNPSYPCNGTPDGTCSAQEKAFFDCTTNACNADAGTCPP
jgi:hypothetical protein